MSLAELGHLIRDMGHGQDKKGDIFNCGIGQGKWDKKLLF